MNTKSSLITFLRRNQVLGLVLLLGGTVSLSAPIVADASVAEKTGKAEVVINGNKSQDQMLKDKWGIEIVAMRSTAAGHMVDFRYRVLDAEKAAPLFKRQTKPYLIHQSSGKALSVPNTAKLGSLRSSNTPQNGRIYWMFFSNHHRLIQKGDKVTVAIGDFLATDIYVE